MAGALLERYLGGRSSGAGGLPRSLQGARAEGTAPVFRRTLFLSKIQTLAWRFVGWGRAREAEAAGSASRATGPVLCTRFSWELDTLWLTHAGRAPEARAVTPFLSRSARVEQAGWRAAHAHLSGQKGQWATAKEAWT